LDRDRESAYWLFTVLVERREDFIRKLAANGIPASVVHLRIDHNSIFGGLHSDLPNQTWFNDRQVAIPVHEVLTVEDVERITRTIISGW
jgi:dTDP-4-amino-4,6-dideoxygalactose transaminase